MTRAAPAQAARPGRPRPAGRRRRGRHRGVPRACRPRGDVQDARIRVQGRRCWWPAPAASPPRRWAARISSSPATTRRSRRRCAGTGTRTARSTSTMWRSATTSCAAAAMAGGCCRRPASRRQRERTVACATAWSIDDTFAEAFPMKATRIVITAHTLEWARHAAVAATGFATSVIGCGCEAGIERELAPARDARRPAGRRGAAVRDVGQGACQADRAPCRPMRADLPDDGGVRRHRRGRGHRAGQEPALLRRRLADLAR